MDEVYVLTPSFNAEKYINETIRSVTSQKCGLKIIYHVQDGASTDGTVPILAKWARRLKKSPSIEFSYCSEPDKGMYDAIQKGVAHLSIPEKAFFTWINADDILCEGAVDSLVPILEAPGVDWIYGRVSRMDAEGFVLNESAGLFPRRLVLEGLADGKIWSCMQQEGMFFRKSLWDAAGGVDTSLRLAGDWDLWRRMACYAVPFFVDRPLARFRIHSGQLTDNLTRYYQEIEAIVPEYVRQRGLRRWCVACFEEIPEIKDGGQVDIHKISLRERIRCFLLTLGMRRLVSLTQTALRHCRESATSSKK